MADSAQDEGYIGASTRGGCHLGMDVFGEPRAATPDTSTGASNKLKAIATSSLTYGLAQDSCPCASKLLETAVARSPRHAAASAPVRLVAVLDQLRARGADGVPHVSDAVIDIQLHPLALPVLVLAAPHGAAISNNSSSFSMGVGGGGGGGGSGGGARSIFLPQVLHANAAAVAFFQIDNLQAFEQSLHMQFADNQILADMLVSSLRLQSHCCRRFAAASVWPGVQGVVDVEVAACHLGSTPCTSGTAIPLAAAAAASGPRAATQGLIVSVALCSMASSSGGGGARGDVPLAGAAAVAPREGDDFCVADALAGLCGGGGAFGQAAETDEALHSRAAGGLDAAVLRGVGCCVSVFNAAGKLVHQNPASVAYMGDQCVPQGLSLEASTRFTQQRLAGGGGAGGTQAAVSGTNGLADGTPDGTLGGSNSPTDLSAHLPGVAMLAPGSDLRQLFCLDPTLLDDLLEALESEPEWQHTVRLPLVGQVFPRKPVRAPTAMRQEGEWEVTTPSRRRFMLGSAPTSSSFNLMPLDRRGAPSSPSLRHTFGRLPSSFDNTAAAAHSAYTAARHASSLEPALHGGGSSNDEMFPVGIWFQKLSTDALGKRPTETRSRSLGLAQTLSSQAVVGNGSYKLPDSPTCGRVSVADGGVGGHVWHEVVGRLVRDPLGGQDLLVLSHIDVTRMVDGEEHCMALLEAEQAILEGLFPRHVIELMVTKYHRQNRQLSHIIQAMRSLNHSNGRTKQQQQHQKLQHAALEEAVGGGTATATASRVNAGIPPFALQSAEEVDSAGGGGEPRRRESALAGQLCPVDAELVAAIDSCTLFDALSGVRSSVTGNVPRQPASVGDDMFATPHEQVTIMFADIVGFTSMCKKVPPATVMAVLSKLYTSFDELLGIFNVYKVETAGDCYIVAGGLMRKDEEGYTSVRTDVDPMNALTVLEFAKVMQKLASRVVNPVTQEPIQLRIGMHTGPVVSGIVGTKMPRFCLFGDTMNTAQRMESKSRPGAIHVSEATQRLLPDECWLATGGIELKGLGTCQTYFWMRPESTMLKRISTSDCRITMRAAGGDDDDSDLLNVSLHVRLFNASRSGLHACSEPSQGVMSGSFAMPSTSRSSRLLSGPYRSRRRTLVENLSTARVSTTAVAGTQLGVPLADLLLVSQLPEPMHRPA